jgi:hypothetical protein
MRKPKPRVARRDEVTITREDDTAVIAFHDGVTPTTNLVVGEKIRRLSDDGILDLYNQSVQGMEYVASTYRHVAKEIPEGSPQIAWHPDCGHWVARGDVLRCYIEDGGEGGEAVIGIDDQELTMHEFGKLLSVFAGWGMRLVIVPDDELTKPPTIKVGEVDH